MINNVFYKRYLFRYLLMNMIIISIKKVIYYHKEIPVSFDAKYSQTLSNLYNKPFVTKTVPSRVYLIDFDSIVFCKQSSYCLSCHK